MLYQTRAIVLRTVKYGESSLIADMFTEQKGHQTFIIHSVRKAKASTPSSYLQLMSLIDMVAYFKEQRKIHHIKEIRLEHPFQSIPFDMRKSAVVTCMGEICSKTLTTAYAQPELFTFLHDQLVAYDLPDRYDRDFLFRFLVGLSTHLGFDLEIPKKLGNGKYLDLMEGHLSDLKPMHDYVMMPEDLLDLQTILRTPPEEKADIPLDTRRRLIDLLILYYQLHVESLREVQSLKILRELL